MAHCQKALADISAAGNFKIEYVVHGPQVVDIEVYDPVSGLKKPMINFSSNNYLGLANHPEVKKFIIQMIEKNGAGAGTMRFMGGTMDCHKELEKTIAEFYGMEDCILNPSGFDANLSFFDSLLTPDDVIVADQYCRASIVDGVTVSKAKKFKFKHMDMNDLERCLKEAQALKPRLILVVTDGIFGMIGDIAPLPRIIELAKAYNAYTFVDECHAIGTIGATGRGSLEYYGLPAGSVDVITATLGKAMGGAAGGFTTSSKIVIELLRQKGRPFIFSNASPPPVVATALCAFKMLTAKPDS